MNERRTVRGQSRGGVAVIVVAESAIPTDRASGKDHASFAGLEIHHVRTPPFSLAFTADRIQDREWCGKEYDIPLSCLMSVDTPNLFAAGRTADGDRRTGASLRVMGTSFATGQAAGVAAAYYAQTKRADAEKIRRSLREQGALIASSEI